MMTAFEIAIIVIGAAACYIILQGVQNMGRILTQHAERNEGKLERIHLELMACNDRLRDIQESFQNLDK